jgi:hypothetical protein
MDLNTAIKVAFNNLVSHVHTAMPARIEKYDAKKQKVDVKPLLNKKYNDGSVVNLPIITSVPLIFPSSGQASLVLPVEKGDTVLLIFAERSIDEWLASGSEVTPSLNRKFDISDAIAIPGLMPFNKNNQQSKATNLEITYKDFKITIDTTGKIAIGKGNVELLKVLSDLIQALITSTTATPAGPQPLSISLDGTLTNLITSLESIRGTL